MLGPPSPAQAGKGAYWGTYVSPPSGQAPLDALTSFESKVGRRFHIYRFYRPIDNGDLGNDIEVDGLAARHVRVDTRAKTSRLYRPGDRQVLCLLTLGDCSVVLLK